MATKPYPFHVLSDKVCIVPGCNQRIKKRLVEVKPTVRYCYKHYTELRQANHSKRR